MLVPLVVVVVVVALLLALKFVLILVAYFLMLCALLNRCPSRQAALHALQAICQADPQVRCCLLLIAA